MEPPIFSDTDTVVSYSKKINEYMMYVQLSKYDIILNLFNNIFSQNKKALCDYKYTKIELSIEKIKQNKELIKKEFNIDIPDEMTNDDIIEILNKILKRIQYKIYIKQNTSNTSNTYCSILKK